MFSCPFEAQSSAWISLSVDCVSRAPLAPSLPSVSLPPLPPQEWDPQYKQLVVKPDRSDALTHDADDTAMSVVCGAEDAAAAASLLLRLMQAQRGGVGAEAGASSSSSSFGGGVVVQPWMGKGAVEFSCLVVGGPGEGDMGGGWLEARGNVEARGERRKRGFWAGRGPPPLLFSTRRGAALLPSCSLPPHSCPFPSPPPPPPPADGPLALPALLSLPLLLTLPPLLAPLQTALWLSSRPRLRSRTSTTSCSSQLWSTAYGSCRTTAPTRRQLTGRCSRRGRARCRRLSSAASARTGPTCPHRL